MTKLNTKIDPEDFRREVGRYKDRWYCDPLPACELADHDPEWQAPSVSTLKKAAAKDWTQVSLRRVADYMAEHRPDISGMSADEMNNLFQSASGDGLDAASRRGTSIHDMFEAYADGVDVEQMEVAAEAVRYRNTVLRILDKHQPKIVMSEFVCLSRTLGYGGTADAAWAIDDRLVLVDYKSRAKNPAVYLEEGWQLSAYGLADYYLDMVDGQVVRRRLPEFDCGMILSITPTDYEMRPVDLTIAYDGFRVLRQFWAFKSAGIGAFTGKPWPKPKMTRDEWIRQRIDTIKDMNIAPLLNVWPEGVAKPKHIAVYDDDMIDLLIPAVDHAEKLLSAPWPSADPGRTDTTPAPEPEPEPEPEDTPPEEGDLMPEAMAAIEHRFSKLTKNGIDWIGDRVKEAREFGHPIRPKELPSARRVFIARALILIVENNISDQQANNALAMAVDQPYDIVKSGPMGMWLSMLSWESAATFAALVKIAAPTGPPEGQPSEQQEVPTEQPVTETKKPTKPRTKKASTKAS